jgi:hypothetical protein
LSDVQRIVGVADDAEAIQGEDAERVDACANK